MHSTLIRAFATGVLAVGTATMANAQQSGPASQRVDVGKYEYDTHCAVCHGGTGKGDGALAASLKKSPADLTKIQKNNGAYFLLTDFTRLLTVGKQSRLTDSAICQYGETNILNKRRD